MSAPLLHTENLAAGYKKALAENLELVLYPQDVVTLIGGNGVGKSTLMRTLSGDLRPLSGKVQINGKDISQTPRRQLAKEISIVDTYGGMSGGLKVHQLVELGRQPYTGVFGLLKGDDKELCRQAMEQTGILHKQDSFVAELSDGERQKAMIARALAQDTPIMFLDEPFSFLDPPARLEIMDMLKTIAVRKEKAVLITCHDVALCLRMASRLWMFMKEGKILDMTPAQAIHSDALERLYKSEKVHFSPTVGDYVINS